MQDILNQLGELVLGSVPTMIFFVILALAYGLLVRRPLEMTLGERHARTGGAMDQAKAAIGDAEKKSLEYETKLREARAKIFESRQERMKRLTAERDGALAAARQEAQQRVKIARESVEKQGAEARAELEPVAAQLSGKILETILSKTQAVQG